MTLLNLFTVTGTVPRLRVSRPSKVASLPTGEAHRELTTWIRKKSWSFISRQILGQPSLESLLDFLGYGHLFFIPYQFEKQRLKRRIKQQRPGLSEDDTKWTPFRLIYPWRRPTTAQGLRGLHAGQKFPMDAPNADVEEIKRNQQIQRHAIGG